jgi:hypothetical protein
LEFSLLTESQERKVDELTNAGVSESRVERSIKNGQDSAQNLLLSCDGDPLLYQPGNTFQYFPTEEYFVDVPHVEHVNQPA